MKVERDHPNLLVDYCAKEFPVKSDTFRTVKYIKGDSVVTVDTVKVDCDTVIHDRIVKVPVTKTVYLTDTIERERLVVQENTAAAEKMRLRAVAAELNAAEQQKSTKNWRLAALVTWGLLAAAAVLTLIFKR